MVEKILERLQKVRKKGHNTWIACCPAHNDKSPSLTIKETADKVLVHCFCGCSAVDIMSAIGLDMTDLYPETLGDTQRVRNPVHARDVLSALVPEIFTVALISRSMLDGKHTQADHDALMIAAERIAAAHSFSEGL